MRIPENIKREILEYGARNIATILGDYLPLKEVRGKFTACCPFHEEKTPSFSVSADRGTWRCFGSCSEGGDAAKFIMKMEGINFNDALIKLAGRGGIAIPGAGETKEEKEKKAIFAALAKAGTFYKDSLAADTNGGKTYVESRMIPEMVETFGIGFAPKNDGKALYNYLKKTGVTEEIAEKAGLIRKDETGVYRDVFWGGRVMFPIQNKVGYTIGFAGRRIDGESRFKYVNSPETVLYKKYSALFGLDKADLSSGEAFVVEGYLDHMQMWWTAGIRNVVATCGTAFTKEHITFLKRLGVRRLNLMFDGDSAGVKATQRAVTLASTEEIKTVVYRLPDDEDPDSYFKKGGKLEDVMTMSGFEFLEKSGVELDGTMRELYRLERLEKAMLFFAKNPAVAVVLKKRGNLDELFSPDALVQIQEVLQQS